jgi:mannose-6-phosphate isomerase-like protein (cupin superfamily)
MPKPGEILTNPVTGQRIWTMITGSESGGRLFRAEGTFPAGGIAGAEHIHPHQDERIEVLDGTAAVTIAGEELILGPGEVAIVSKGTPHTFRNVGEGDLRALMEFRPAPPSTALFYELLFGLAQEGRMKDGELPGMLDMALIWPLTSEHTVFTKPPAWVLGALGPFAKARKLPAYAATMRGEPVPTST